MEINFLAALLAALVPLVIGAVWYNPKVLGTAWMKSAGLTEESLRGANMPLIFGLSFVFSFLLAIILHTVVVHQYHVQSTLMSEPGFFEEGSEVRAYLASFMESYGDNYRTFKHGALHGAIAGFFIALPILGINALFERKGFRYIAINAGYWVITLTLMGGIICAM